MLWHSVQLGHWSFSSILWESQAQNGYIMSLGTHYQAGEWREARFLAF